jgi:hypothetical protein
MTLGEFSKACDEKTWVVYTCKARGKMLLVARRNWGDTYIPQVRLATPKDLLALDPFDCDYRD